MTLAGRYFLVGLVVAVLVAVLAGSGTAAGAELPARWKAKLDERDFHYTTWTTPENAADTVAALDTYPLRRVLLRVFRYPAWTDAYLETFGSVSRPLLKAAIQAQLASVAVKAARVDRKVCYRSEVGTVQRWRPNAFVCTPNRKR